MPNKRKLALLIIAGFAATAWSGIASADDSSMLERIYSAAWKNVRSVQYVPLRAEELVTMQQLFTRVMKGEQMTETVADLRALGWSVHTQTMGNASWTIVAEASNQRKGRGLYAFSSKGRHAIQAPHVPSDALTGQILLGYAQDALPRALAWNTVPRRVADLAHLDGTTLIAFSRAFASAFPTEKILQFHGFDARRRRSNAGAQSSAIVSSAHGNPPPALVSTVKCMQQKIEKRTRLYGVDVRELGGTRNSVARALLKDGYQGFIHVEMDRPLRKRLATDPTQRQVLLSCLGGTR